MSDPVKPLLRRKPNIGDAFFLLPRNEYLYSATPCLMAISLGIMSWLMLSADYLHTGWSLDVVLTAQQDVDTALAKYWIAIYVLGSPVFLTTLSVLIYYLLSRSVGYSLLSLYSVVYYIAYTFQITAYQPRPYWTNSSVKAFVCDPSPALPDPVVVASFLIYLALARAMELVLERGDVGWRIFIYTVCFSLCALIAYSGHLELSQQSK